MSELVSVDDVYDADYASDGGSRYGAYLRQRSQLFADEGDELDRVSFAVLAWQIACSPIMAPGYVCSRGDVERVRCWHGEEPGLLVADVEVRIRPVGLLDGPAQGWATWTRDTTYGREHPAFLEPREDRRALLLTAHLRVPIPAGELIEPTRTRLRGVDVAEAKTAVSVICRFVNNTAGPTVAHLRELRCGSSR